MSRDADGHSSAPFSSNRWPEESRQVNHSYRRMSRANVTWTCRGFDLRYFARDLSRKSLIGAEKSSLDDSGQILENNGINLAERVGFEPTVEFPLHTLSKRA